MSTKSVHILIRMKHTIIINCRCVDRIRCVVVSAVSVMTIFVIILYLNNSVT